MPFGAPAQPWTDRFEELFTGREQECAEFRRLLGSRLGAPLPVQIHTGVAGVGKTYLRRRFQEIARTMGVPFDLVELDPDRGGMLHVEDERVALRLARAAGVEAPRVLLGFLASRLDSSDKNDVFQVLVRDGLIKLSSDLMKSLISNANFTLSGIIDVFIKIGVDEYKKSKEPLARYLKTEEGKKDLAWLQNRPPMDEIRRSMALRLACDLADQPDPIQRDSHSLLPRAARAVLFVESLEKASHLSWMRRFYEASCAEDGSDPRLLVVGFGQNPPELNLPDGHVRIHRLEGWSGEEARAYITQKRGFAGADTAPLLAWARESGDGDLYHPFCLGLTCDILAQDGKGDLVERESQDGEDRVTALTRRFLLAFERRVEGRTNHLKQLALTPGWDRPAIALAFHTGTDENALDHWEQTLREFSFVQPLDGGRSTLHAVMRRALTESATPEQRDRWHAAWIAHWCGRIADPTDDAAASCWHHRFSRPEDDVWEKWSEEAEEAWGAFQSLRHEFMIMTARAFALTASLNVSEAPKHVFWAEQVQKIQRSRTQDILQEGVEVYRLALSVHTRTVAPDSWAWMQWRLGVSLTALGEITVHPPILQDAVSTFHLALKVHTYESSPSNWANTQNDLGVALGSLGRLTANTEILSDSVAAFKLALNFYTFTSHPANWRGIQHNLGNVQLILGELTADTLTLGNAITAFQSALSACTLESAPDHWMKIQTSLGCALESRGRHARDPKMLLDAVDTFELVLRVGTREATPAHWAGIQNNIGAALSTLGQLTEDETKLRNAVVACHLALEVRTRESTPADWAATHTTLGSALLGIGRLTQDLEILREAVSAFGHALTVYRGYAPALERLVLINVQVCLFNLLELSPPAEHDAIKAEIAMVDARRRELGDY